MIRSLKSRNFLPLLGLIALLPLSAFTASAQDDPNAPQPPPAAPQTAPATPDQPAPAPAAPAVPQAEVPAPDALPPATTVAAPPPAPVPPPPPPELSSKFKKDCQVLHKSAAGNDPIGLRYLVLIETGKATARDYNDFGVFLARRYYLGIAEDFVEHATKMDAPNIEYWLNLGTVRLQFGKLSSALLAYQKARKINVNNAQAHYGIGVVHDYMLNYDESVDAYVHALALDPSLGDPMKNPQAANNERLTVVKLLLYQAGGGGMALPLHGGPTDDPKKPKPFVASNGNGKKS